MTSIVPEFHPFAADLHFVLCDFGQFGRAFVETRPEDASQESIIRNMVSGEYDRPLRVLALNPEQGWSRDVSQEVAKAVARAVSSAGSELSVGTLTFVQEQLGAQVLA